MNDDYITDIDEVSIVKCLQDITIGRFIWLINPTISMEIQDKYYCSCCSMEWNKKYRLIKCFSVDSWIHIKEHHHEHFYNTVLSYFYWNRARKLYNYLRRRYALMVSYAIQEQIRSRVKRMRSLRWSITRQDLIESSYNINYQNIFGKLRIHQYDSWRLVIAYL